MIKMLLFILLLFLVGNVCNAVYNMQEAMIDSPALIAAELATPKFQVTGGIPVIGHIIGFLAFSISWITYLSELTLVQWDFLQGPAVFIQVILYFVIAALMGAIFISLLMKWRE